MSFSVGAEDTISSLEELVIFIDAWDADSNNSNGLGDVTTSESENDSSPFSNDDVESVLLDSLDDVVVGEASFLPEERPEAKKPMKRSRKKAPGASTRLQRRKKAEIMALRAQSHELQRKLEQLQRRSTTSMSLANFRHQSGTVPTSWSAIAATEYQERLKSEMMNQKLRSVILEQMKMSEALQGVFQTQASLGNFESVFGRQPSSLVQLPSTEPGCSVAVIDGLEKMVEELYLDSEAVFQHKEGPFTTNTLQVMQVQTRGRVIEIAMTIAIPCSMHQASEMFWREYLTVRYYNDKSYHFLRQRRPASVEKSFVWLLQGDAGARELNGFTFVRKIEEPNQVVLVEASRLLPATGGVQYRLQRWTIITRSDGGPQPSSVVRTMIQLHAERTSDLGGLQEAENVVMGTLSQRLRAYLQRLQGEFVLEAERTRFEVPASDI